MVDITGSEWAGPPTTTQRAHTLKGHQEVGGSAFSRNQNGSAALVSGGSGPEQARMVGPGVYLAVNVQRPGTLLTPFETAIVEFGGVFITRGHAEVAIPTAIQYSLVPIGGFSLSEPQQSTAGPAPRSVEWGRVGGVGYLFACFSLECLHIAV